VVDEDGVDLIDEELSSEKNNGEVGLCGKEGEHLVWFGGVQ